MYVQLKNTANECFVKFVDDVLYEHYPMCKYYVRSTACLVQTLKTSFTIEQTMWQMEFILGVESLDQAKLQLR